MDCRTNCSEEVLLMTLLCLPAFTEDLAEWIDGVEFPPNLALA